MSPDQSIRPNDWRKWYGLSIWQRRRKAQLRAEPLCALCLKEGKAEPAKVADHIRPHRGNWNAFRLGELQSLCQDHHNSLKRTTERRGYDPTIGPDGFPSDPTHPVYRAQNN
jgi:5-methylcytosine-specific restriction endonuclease McrA